MTSNPIPNPSGRILAMLEDDPPRPEYYTPSLIERLPLDDITTRLDELGITPAMPDRVRELVENGSGPAVHLLSLLDSEGNTNLDEVEQCPLAEVVTALDRLGINHVAGLERIREILDPETAEALRASATSLNATWPSDAPRQTGSPQAK